MRCRVCEHSDFAAREGTLCPADGSLLVDEKALESHPHDVLLGQMFGDEFGLVSVLGEGGFGTVYKAIQFPVKRPVAVKVLHSHYYRHEGVRQRFFQEARAIGSLTDSSIVKLIRFGELPPGKPLPGCGGYFFIAQEFIQGPTLRQLTRREGVLGELRAINIGIQILKALADAHRFGLIHRDLKPGNIMLTTDALGDEAVKVLDFGVAKMLEDFDQPEESTPDTLTGVMLGTPNYMAPEQILGDGLCPATDLYAVGVLLHEMLTGRRPFQRSSRAETLRAQLSAPPPEIPDNLNLSTGIRDVILCALSKKVAYRYQDARSFIGALRAIHGASTDSQNASMPSLPPVGGRSHLTQTAVQASAQTAIDEPAVRLNNLQATTEPSDGPEVIITSASSKGPWMVITALAIALLIGGGFILLKADPSKDTQTRGTSGQQESKNKTRIETPKVPVGQGQDADRPKEPSSGPGRASAIDRGVPEPDAVPEAKVTPPTPSGSRTKQPSKRKNKKARKGNSKSQGKGKTRAAKPKRIQKSAKKPEKPATSKEKMDSPPQATPSPAEKNLIEPGAPKKPAKNTPIREL